MREKSNDMEPLGIRQSGAGLFVWIVLLAFCGLTAYVGWKLWPLAQGVHGIYKQIQRQKKLPNPVVIQDGVYWFPLGGRVFAVPEAWKA
jgi:hypothetical protein